MEDKDNKTNKNLPISSLEQIDEKNELYESINETEEEMDPDSKIAELQQKIITVYIEIKYHLILKKAPF